jgi:CHAT domain-containing protein
VRNAARRLRYQLPRAGLSSEYAGRHAGQMLTSTISVLQRLYDLLLRPLSDLLTTERIVVVPHGVLHGLPFHAFHAGAEYALDRWEFVYAPSGSFWHTSAQRRMRRSGTSENITAEADSLLLMGVPAPGIERVASEVAQVAKLWEGSRLFSAEQATLETFRQNAETSRYLHLATHALFRADNPLFSGIRFADGWLLARDLYEMRVDCDLATLSPSSTGVTRVEPGDELFGILRGFLAAGARSVAASLWPADDAATAELMERFYELLVSGVSKAAALRQAQRELRAGSPHPYHWAAFALVGEP